MIKIVHAADLYRRPLLAASMYKDRALQFKERLGWEAVSLDDKGLEFDQYDDLNPVYVIVEDEDGQHCGSGRLMPTTGRTMTAEHFSHLTGGVDIRSPLIWEVTRLCVSPRLNGSSLARRVPAALFYAGYDAALRAGVEFFVAVYFGHMHRVWKSIGCTPELLGSEMTADGEICAGLWEITQEMRDELGRRAGLIAETPLSYFPSPEKFDQQRAPETKSSPLRLAA
jgi:acyl homoserine lactone synthase